MIEVQTISLFKCHEIWGSSKNSWEQKPNDHRLEAPANDIFQGQRPSDPKNITILDKPLCIAHLEKNLKFPVNSAFSKFKELTKQHCNKCFLYADCNDSIQTLWLSLRWEVKLLKLLWNFSKIVFLSSESNFSHGFSPSRKSVCWACCSVLCYGSGPRNSGGKDLSKRVILLMVQKSGSPPGMVLKPRK